ncbi:MAG: nucleotidyl transferase AbiEii/AbiGii toxin family protein [Lachnospiraceae bacterium]|nr:nucleotidyl transferase AbiEii/AbiGii toxin family protein [Candidatus Equihabitans merdae]
MNDAIFSMMERYNCRNSEDYENALKEIVQEVALMGLSRSGFFSKAAFYGGTALRIFYGLPRYSEDLDFSLDVPDAAFDLAPYLSYVERELKAYNFSMTVRKKEKTKETAVQSAFIKGNTVQNILEITSNDASVYGINPQAILKIKFEVDTNPPEGAGFQYMNAINPAIYRVRLYDMPSLFAGKMHAVLCRDYKHRVKGRDFYDYIWYLKRNCSVNLMHLQRRMEQSGKWNPEEELTMPRLKEMLMQRFQSVDFDSAKADVSPFLSLTEKEGLEFWSADFFIDITERYLQ